MSKMELAGATWKSPGGFRERDGGAEGSWNGLTDEGSCIEAAGHVESRAVIDCGSEQQQPVGGAGASSEPAAAAAAAGYAGHAGPRGPRGPCEHGQAALPCSNG